MNHIAAWLFGIGWITIIGGIVLGFSNMGTMVPETDMFGDTTMVEGQSWTIFFMYFFAGIISGLMMFGFAEIVNLLDKGNQTRQRIENHLKHENKMSRDQKVTESHVENEPTTPKSATHMEMIEKEIREIEANDSYSTDMKLAMKASVKKREGFE